MKSQSQSKSPSIHVNKRTVSRRRFLRGMGGVVVGLPALDVFQRRASGAVPPPTKKIYSAWMLQNCGLVQGPHFGTGGGPITAVVANAPPETDMFWPKATGSITAAAMMGADADQATSQLVDYASKLIFVRGSSFKHSFQHGGGPVAAMTGAPVTGVYPRENPKSESAEFFISRMMNGGKPPLTLYVGRKNQFRDDCFSFGLGGGNPRVGESNPFNVYQDITGLTGAMKADPAMVAKLAAQDLSVNDLVRGELKDLLARTDLSMDDRHRIDLHLSSIREMEMNMTTVLGPMLDATALTNINGKHEQDAFIESAALMQMDLIAFAFASDLYRSAAVQIGGANDHTRYTVDGVLAPAYHPVSHRNNSDGQNGPLIANSVQLHHGIDKIHARMFKRLLDKMAAYTLPQGGTLLDSSVNVWTNSLDDGPTHGSNNIPYVLAGGAAGFLKTGIHMVLPMGSANNLVLNTVVSAAGCRKANGDLVDNFGDPAFPGLIPEIIA
ncbi:MAG TPA: DUF1552 domain-containing protein [Polyangia bacterium]|nr:DUF1552 domain-containing protein [Polyangia bacterium]